jgi:hypothetical protein
VAGPVYLLLVAFGLGFFVLLGPLETDGSYGCDGNALTTIISPEPEGRVPSVAFNAPAACNHTARERGLVALGILGVGAAVGGAWTVARHRSGMYD